MASPLADQIRDRLVVTQLGSLQFTNGTVRRVLAELAKAEAPTLATAQQAYTGQRRSLKRFLDAIDEIQGNAYARAHLVNVSDLEHLVQREARLVISSTREAFPATWRQYLGFQLPREHILKTLPTRRPFQGKLLRDWYGRLAADTQSTIRQTLLRGIADGRDVREITTLLQRFLRGTPRHRVATIARTAAGSAAESMREAYYRANPHLFDGLVWLSVLDGSTTLLCIERAGLRYTLAGEPVGHAVGWEGGPGRIHYSCRSSSAPVLVSPEEAVRRKAELGTVATGRAATVAANRTVASAPPPLSRTMARRWGDGVPSPVDATAFLRRQPAGTVRELLGSALATAWLANPAMRIDDVRDLSRREFNAEDLVRFDELTGGPGT